MKKELTCEQQLEDLKQEYEEFAYIVSHDLKAPLRAISNLSGWIKEDLGDQMDEDVQNNILLLQNRTERLERMINGLLTFSRIPRMDLEVREVNVESLVAEISATFRETYQAEVHTSALPTFTTYSKKLETVLHHLVQNAVKFNARETPQVWVEASEQEDAFVFTVRDNGMGIPADIQEKVFKMFYTVQPKDKEENLGVGLTICRKIVQFVGGDITLTSTPEIGTEVQVYWPKHVNTPATQNL
ncbi:sensor histidine kinase [Rufibacter immobilis]|uniref:sensor histidine kinase n=1 Tax=Rufibacter immobilis TaxID=1348778 RepID=UPI0035E56CC9